MRILVVVHGFPPFAQGGSEIYARTHALALRQQFGDEVLVLTREQDPRRPEYDVRSERCDGLQIAWVNNTFRQVRSFEDSYRNPAIARIATSLIDDFAPDVAHIHHLTCLSTEIVRALADRRIPRIVTLHDYWFICHRGQLLDVNYQVCDGPESGGCGNCLGPVASAGPVSFAGAAALRSLEPHIPEASARRLRQIAERAFVVGRSKLRPYVEGRSGHSRYGPARRGLAELPPPSGRSTAQDPARRVGAELAPPCDERRRVDHMREVCANVSHFIAPSRCMRDRFVRFGIDPDRISVAGYGFNPLRTLHGPRRVGAELAPPNDTDNSSHSSGDRLRIGFLGSLMASKAPHVLLEAVERLPRGSVSVDLLGSYVPYHGDDRYRETLDELTKHSAVRARGAIPQDRVPQALAELDVLVVPSIWPENSPLVIQEAFLAGVPVVASRIGGIPEVVNDGVNGVLFNPGDAADLASKLARFIDEPSLLKTLRGGIPTVRTITEDINYSRAIYRRHVTNASSARPRLAAIVLNFRTPDETLLTVRSLLASRVRIHDIIVVNNDSVDAARPALESVWSRIRYLHTGRNLGFSGGMNAGIRAALAGGADRVLLVNSDVIVPPDCIERLEHALAEKGNGIAGPIVLARAGPDRIASAGMRYVERTGRMRHLRVGEPRDACSLASQAIVDGVAGCVMMIRRDVFDAIGLLDEDYFFSFEDLDFCLRARGAGFATVVSGTATAYHEGGRSIGVTSPRRLYFAARNHLLMAGRVTPPAGPVGTVGRLCSIVALNLAHAVMSNGASLGVRLGAVVRGTNDYIAGRFGSDVDSTSH